MEKRWLDISEASEYTTLHVGTLYNMVSRGDISCVKLGRRVVFDVHDLDAHMEEHRRQAKNGRREKLETAGVRVIPGGIFDDGENKC